MERSIKPSNKHALLLLLIAFLLAYPLGAQEVSLAKADVDRFVQTSSSVQVCDVDGDGDLDLVYSVYGGAVHVCENTAGKGKPPVFAAPKPVMCDEGPVKFGTRNNAIRVTDINADGKLDLLISSEYAAFDVGTEVCVWYRK